MNKIYWVLFALSITNLAYGQVEIVKDINKEPASILEDNHYNDIFCECGDYIYFAVDNELGKELWKTDGTTGGTSLVIDLNKNHADGILASFACLDNTLYFMGRDGKQHNKYKWDLWSTDGSADGTNLIKTLDNNATDLLTANNKIFGTRSVAGNNLELWSSDGTEAGTQVYTSISNNDSYSQVFESIAIDSQIYYEIGTYIESQYVFQLWTSNGTEEGTYKLLESANYINNMIGLAGKLHFVTTSESIYQLRISDGTVEGTQLVTEMDNHVQGFIPFDDQLVFTSGGSHWITDGTESGTIYLSTGNVYSGVVINELFYGVGYDYETNSYFLMSTDGTQLNTNKIVDLGASAQIYHDIPVIGNQMILPIHSEVYGEELGISDGTAEGTIMLKDLYTGSESSIPRSFINYKGKALFLAKDATHGTELWSTDGTADGSIFVKDILPGTKSLSRFDHKLHIQELNNRLFFTASSSDNPLYESDGSGEGTENNLDITGSIELLGKLKNSLIYFNSSKFYNVSTTGVSLIDDYSSDISGIGLTVNNARVAGDKMYFELGIFNGTNEYGYEYWVTDGSVGGTKILKDINEGAANGLEFLAGGAINDQFIFTANNGTIGNEIWITDGTEENTIILKDIHSGSESSNPSMYVSLGSELFFVADDGIHGRELWKTNGTTSGTILVSDIIESSEGSDPRFLTAFKQEIYFSAYDASAGWSLWKTNGTDEGTKMVLDLNPENDDASLGFSNIYVAGEKLYFTANDGISGNELWVSDGTAEGTITLDILEGSTSSFPDLLTEVEDFLYFKANNQIWRTDGTEYNTSLVADYHALELVYMDQWIYFSAPSKAYGVELFKVPFTKFDQMISFDPIPVKVMGDEDIVLNASSSSGLDIQFSANNKNVEFNGNLASIISYGSTTIIADQFGNDFYNSAQAKHTFCINANQPIITVKDSNTTATILVSSNDKGNQWYLNGDPLENGKEQSFYAFKSGNYTVSTTSENCSTTNSDEISIVVTAINESPGVDFHVYPNPTSDYIHFETDQLNIPFSVEIINIHGQVMDEILISNSQWEHSVKSYPKGLYFIKAESIHNQLNSYRFIKN